MARGGGLDGATLVALVGVAVSLAFNVFNLCFTTMASRKSARLSEFNSFCRGPIESSLSALAECSDEASSISRLDFAARAAATNVLSAKFHMVRRRFTRTMNDVQTSARYEGTRWVSFQEDECDRATESLETARGAHDLDQSDNALTAFISDLENLRGRALQKIESHYQRISTNKLWRWLSLKR